MGHKMVRGFVLFFFLSNGSAIAGWFGPSTFEECFLAKMKGQSSSMRRTAYSACRAEFPIKEPTAEEKEELARQIKAWQHVFFECLAAKQIKHREQHEPENIKGVKECHEKAGTFEQYSD